MSRHRDVRCMNYSDEYDGYDDVYGHSVEDDYCVSPSAEQFLFDRSKQQNIASFITEPDIVEDNEEDIVDDIGESSSSVNEEKCNLSELERAKLISCIETIRNVIGDTVPESKLREKIISSNFDADVALDAILKESSPKNASDSTANKERLERHPGVSIDKPNTSMFTIPKLSFKKEAGLLKDSSSIISHSNPIDKDIKHSPKIFSSLTGLISHHTESTSLDTRKSPLQNSINAQPFGSLAALTAHHLQKSNSNSNTEFCKNQQSPSSQFVIPKLAIKRNNSEETGNVQLSKSDDSENNKMLVYPNSLSKHSTDLLQKDFSNMHIFPKSDIASDVKSEEQFKKSTNSISEIRAASPDNWIIDLSTALKEAEFLTDNSFSNVKLTTSKKFYYDMPNLDLCVEKSSVILNVLPVTLNLCDLRHVKLPYTKKKVSVFGKTVCRKWKTGKPIFKVTIQRHDTIKPFDFSTPYRNTNRS